ncbi:2-dehydropantoate 2-reductase [Burkholderiales bacterium 8X]|nr:2-dehydropantoate 2-reductase [Burkholderiales bacterium 8X]
MELLPDPELADLPAPARDAAAVPIDVLVMGAGAVGCFVGGSLAGQGVRVMFVGRPRMLEALALNGIRLSDLDGNQRRVSPAALALADHVPPGVAPTLVLLTVKSGATVDAAAELGSVLPPGTHVVSLQNGICNVDLAAKAAPSLRVLRGMVPFNVAELAPGLFHRGTSGRIVVQRSRALRPWLGVFARAGVPLDLRSDMNGVQWGKLLLNLNNPVNALSGLPLRAELMDAGYRRCLAALMDEALAALDAAFIAPSRLSPLPARLVPAVLRLPTPLFKLVAARMLRIDAEARSSMADDLAAGRRTEIDALCGEVVRLAEANDLKAPVNARMIELVERWPESPHPLSARQLKAALQLG